MTLPTIRKAESNDLKQIFELEVALFGKDSYPYFFFCQALDALGDLFFVIEIKKSKIIAYALASLEKQRNDAWVLSLGVHPDNQKEGFGKSLVIYLLKNLYEMGATFVYLHVSPDNAAARNLYKKMGFFVSRYEKDYFGLNHDRLIMKADLIKVIEKMEKPNNAYSRDFASLSP